jgi:threonine synthase
MLHNGLEIHFIYRVQGCSRETAQAIAYGADIIAIDGNFDQALQLVRDTAAKHAVAVVNSINPNRIEGQKTAAFEIVDILGQAPDYLFIPVGNAGNITAYWKGFSEYYKMGRSLHCPKMMGFQAEGAAPIVLGKPWNIRKPRHCNPYPEPGKLAKSHQCT